jgi:antibiotic biosynthesis monooxygenase (ABM) superfamily enzyme
MTMPLSRLKKVGTPITRNLVKMEAFQARMGSQAQDQGIQHHERREDFWKQSSEEEEACESRSCMSSYFLVQTHHHPILSIARSTSCTWKRLCTFMTFYICSSLQKTSCLPPIVSFLLFQSPCCMCLLVGFFFVSCLSTLVDSQ